MGDQQSYLPPTSRYHALRAWRTPLVWIALIIAFFAAYRMFLSAPTQPAHHVMRLGKNAVAAHSSNFDFGSWIMPLALVYIIVMAGWLIAMNRRTKAFGVENAVALKFLSLGDAARASEEFERIQNKFRWPVHLRYTAMFNTAVALTRKGNLAEALKLYETVDAHLPVRCMNLRPSLALQIATIQGLMGDLETSEAWTAEVHKRKQRFADFRAVDAHLWTPRTVVSLRRGKYDEALRALDEHWREVESVMTADAIRPLRVLRAFAVAQARGPREAGAAESLMAGLRPVMVDEFVSLGTAWPEMRLFLQTNGL